jgi:glycosyltransferase involved in cell wall biosynthesis
MSDPLVSVIMPAFNAALYVREALESIAAQTFRDVEIVLVDDCSTDHTMQVVKEWVARQPEGDGSVRLGCQLLRTERNAGQATARNVGIRKAKGEWIAFLDADDAWLPHRLATQLQLAAARPEVAMWSAGTMGFCGEDGGRYDRPSENTNEHHEENGSISASEPPLQFLPVDAFAVRNPVATSTVLIRRDSLLAVVLFDEQFRGPEDYDLWIRVAARYPVAKIDIPLSRYRILEGSSSMDDERFLPQVFSVLEKAYGPGGGLEDLQEFRSRALATQYRSASWMAFCAKKRHRAVRLWAMGYKLRGVSRYRELRVWWPLLIRYLVGRARPDDH